MNRQCTFDLNNEHDIQLIINFTRINRVIKPAIDKIYPLLKNRDPIFVKQLITTNAPLHYLSELNNDTKEHCEIMRLIVLYGNCDIDRMPWSYGRTALHMASYHGHQKIVTELLKMGADPSITDRQTQETPREVCCNAYQIERYPNTFVIEKLDRILNIFDNPPLTYKTLAERKILTIVLNALVPLGTKAQVGEILKQLGWP